MKKGQRENLSAEPRVHFHGLAANKLLASDRTGERGRKRRQMRESKREKEEGSQREGIGMNKNKTSQENK